MGVRIESRAVMQALGQLADTARAMGGARVEAGSTEPYTFGIETGRTRSGRLARAAGGAWMLRDAKAAIAARIQPTLAAALMQGPAAADAAFRGLGDELVREIQARTPVVSGRLRGSMRVLAGGIGSRAAGLRAAFFGGERAA
jgi:hypothetical protein